MQTTSVCRGVVSIAIPVQLGAGLSHASSPDPRNTQSSMASHTPSRIQSTTPSIIAQPRVYTFLFIHPPTTSLGRPVAHAQKKVSRGTNASRASTGRPRPTCCTSVDLNPGRTSETRQRKPWSWGGKAGKVLWLKLSTSFFAFGISRVGGCVLVSHGRAGFVKCVCAAVHGVERAFRVNTE